MNIIFSQNDNNQIRDVILRYLYTLLFYLILPFVFLRLLWRSRRSADYRKRWSERLGFCPFTLEKCIWVHAASVGETLAAIPLIKILQTRYPHIPILVTNMTITGSLRTKAAFGDSVFHTYIPYDVPSALKRFLNRTRPLIAIMIETELWPNLFFACHDFHIPTMVMNARLSEKSAKGYQRVAFLTRPMLKTIHTVAVQTQIESDRFVALGLPQERAVVTGSIKFDIETPKELVQKSQILRERAMPERLIWIAASTHAGEEEIVLAAHQQICKTIPHALLLLVPRHPERFDTVFSLAKQMFQTVRRSQDAVCTPETHVYLSDTMGELLLMYAVCDVAFVAGSFAAVGGHNMLEAAVLGKPIVTGPVLFNFAEISEKLIHAHGMKKVKNADELAAEVIHLLQDAVYRKTMGDHARQVLDENRGALEKQVELIASVLN